jgi:2-hydroxy-6-oxonona-2,4-dienedioate hydrolase
VVTLLSTRALKEPTDLAIWPALSGVQLSQHFLQAGRFRTRVLEAGEGPDLILMHGTGGHLEAFMRNLANLAQDFHVVAFDFVGHGYSDGPDEPYTIETYAEQLVGLLVALGIERASLSGESLGGWVAAWVAAHRPELVDRLILAVPGNVTMKLETMKRLRESTSRAVLEASVETVRARLEWLFAPDNRWLVTDELVQIRYQIYTRPGAAQRMENVLVLQDPEVRTHYTWTADWCGQIVAPTLILWTEHDPTGPVSEGELLREWIPGSRLEVMADAGHWPQWERPGEFDRVHREFLLPLPGSA